MLRELKISKVISCLIVVTVSLCFIFASFDFVNLKNVVEENVWVENYVQISAHRGGAHLNPENTKKAFDYVIKETSYTDIVEIDLRLTKDNIIVINHDSDINRMSLDENEESVYISENNYSDLINYNLGRNFVGLDNSKPYFDYSILEAKRKGLILMTLEQFFQEYSESREFKVFLEVKESDIKGQLVVDKIIEMLDVYSWFKDRIMIITFDDKLIDYMALKYKDLYVGALGRKVGYQIGLSKAGLDIFYNPNYQSIQVPYNQKAKDQLFKLNTKMLINSFKERNQLVVYWGVNNKEDMKKLIDLGVHVITTDRPDLLNQILIERY